MAVTDLGAKVAQLREGLVGEDQLVPPAPWVDLAGERAELRTTAGAAGGREVGHLHHRRIQEAPACGRLCCGQRRGHPAWREAERRGQRRAVHLADRNVRPVQHRVPELKTPLLVRHAERQLDDGGTVEGAAGRERPVRQQERWDGQVTQRRCDDYELAAGVGVVGRKGLEVHEAQRRPVQHALARQADRGVGYVRRRLQHRLHVARHQRPSPPLAQQPHRLAPPGAARAGEVEQHARSATCAGCCRWKACRSAKEPLDFYCDFQVRCEGRRRVGRRRLANRREPAEPARRVRRGPAGTRRSGRRDAWCAMAVARGHPGRCRRFR